MNIHKALLIYDKQSFLFERLNKKKAK